MSLARIAIVSSQKDFLRFFELEATRLGFSAVCDSRFTTVMKGCSGMILDAETAIPLISAEPALLISARFSPVLRQVSENRQVYQLSWPCPVSELEAFLLPFRQKCDVTSLKKTKKSDEPEICFEKDPHYVWYQNQRIMLSDTEQKLLFVLCQAAGAVVPRKKLDEILDCEKGNLTDVYICHLRNKLEKPFSVRLIETVRGQGYRIQVHCVFMDKEDALWS